MSPLKIRFDDCETNKYKQGTHATTKWAQVAEDRMI